MSFASVKEVIRRFSGLEDRFQAIFVLFRAFSWTFRLELCSCAKGQRLGSTKAPKCWNNVAVDCSPRCCFNRWNSLRDPYQDATTRVRRSRHRLLTRHGRVSLSRHSRDERNRRAKKVLFFVKTLSPDRLAYRPPAVCAFRFRRRRAARRRNSV